MEVLGEHVSVRVRPKRILGSLYECMVTVKSTHGIFERAHATTTIDDSIDVDKCAGPPTPKDILSSMRERVLCKNEPRCSGGTVVEPFSFG